MSPLPPLHRFGPYELHDLVVLDQATVGVIVEISKDACKVLTNQGSVERPELRTCRLPDIKRKMVTRNATTSDLALNQVGRHDTRRPRIGWMNSGLGGEAG